MLNLLRDLVVHKGHANTTILQAIETHPAASVDPEIIELLHHILVANRFWYQLWVGESFDRDREFEKSPTLEALRSRYDTLQRLEEAWLAGLTDADLSRTLATPHIPGGRCSLAEGLMQVCLHSHGHRAQLARMLRAHGGAPPMTDFILWVAQRQAQA